MSDPSKLEQIRRFDPATHDWLELECMLESLFTQGADAQAADALLSLLERVPEGEESEVLWSVIHGLESIEGYEAELIKAVERYPTEHTVVMLNRLLNGGICTVGDESLLHVLARVQDHPRARRRARSLAACYLQRHESAV